MIATTYEAERSLPDEGKINANFLRRSGFLKSTVAILEPTGKVIISTVDSPHYALSSLKMLQNLQDLDRLRAILLTHQTFQDILMSIQTTMKARLKNTKNS